MQITITSDFFPGRAIPPGGNLVGDLLSMFLDKEGNIWFAFSLPDVYGIETIPADSRFLVSIFGE